VGEPREQTEKDPPRSSPEPNKLLIELIKDNTVFVRHYEDIRFKFAQLSITLTAALVGFSRLSAISTRDRTLIGLFIVTLGVSGILITLKYTERADRHAAISRGLRRAASKAVGELDGTTVEAVYADAAQKHSTSTLLVRYMSRVRARFFWIFLHILVVLLGVYMST